MTAGLQIWNESGQLILDGTHRCGRVLSMQPIIGGNGGSFTDSRLNAGTVWWAFQRDRSFHLGYGFGGIMSPSFSFSGNTLTWTYMPKNKDYDEYAAGQVVIGIM